MWKRNSTCSQNRHHSQGKCVHTWEEWAESRHRTFPSGIKEEEPGKRIELGGADILTLIYILAKPEIKGVCESLHALKFGQHFVFLIYLSLFVSGGW